MTLTIKNIEKLAEKNGLKIAIGHPGEWGIYCKQKRAYSYSVKNNLGLWQEPKTIQAYNLKDLLSDVNYLILHRGV